MVNILFEFIKAFFILFISYAANVFPPLAKGKRPMDFGKKLGKNRIFGDGKTFEGFLVGLLAGFLVGVLSTYLYSYLNPFALAKGFSLPTMSLFIGFLIAFGALFGDLIGSFLKRRFGFGRGKDVLLLDQLDFIFGALIFSYFFTEITIYMIIIMLVITPLIHRAACIIGYWWKVKKEPW